MLHTKAQSIEAIKTIARALDDLNDLVVYVGGAVVGLYADDPGAPEVRPTKDIDIVLEIASAFALETIRQKLAHLEPAIQTKRYEILEQKLREIIA